MKRAEAIAREVRLVGGKSGLGRARWLVTPTRRKPRESATEKTPPKRALASAGKGEMVR